MTPPSASPSRSRLRSRAWLAAPLVVTYLETGLVPRLPTAILVTGLSIVGLLTLMSGIILETVTRGRRESKRMQYLSYPALQGTSPPPD